MEKNNTSSASVGEDDNLTSYSDVESAAKVRLDLELIQKRSAILQASAKELKSHFIGIDSTIDEIISAMRVWVLMPEALSRPVIINLWGMTGVGKTDLIRRLISSMNLQDRFIEIELSTGTGDWYSSVASILSNNAMNDPEPKVILFDEIQRFKTTDKDGEAKANTKFSDFWELLSDGRLSKRDRDDLEFILFDLKKDEQDYQKDRKKGESKDEYKMGTYNAQYYKELLDLKESLQEILEMSRKEIIRRLEQARTRKQVYEPVDHSKTLIFISGNLDDAFSMAKDIAEADVDADIFSAFTEQVSIVDIKRALSNSFRPEQVARFGNIHIIYRSLRKADFVGLIRREIKRIKAGIWNLFGIRVEISQEIESLIYSNGVFPTQGVRPVFSSLSDILESNLSLFVLEEMIVGGESIAVSYDASEAVLKAELSNGETIKVPFVGRLDKARQSNAGDIVANISAHEAGHAIVYGVLFGLAPLQLVSKIASTENGGFTFPHKIHETRGTMLSKIQVFLAGGIAEEILFGADNASTGRVNDRERATRLAIEFIRRYGFDSTYLAFYTMDEGFQMETEKTDESIEALIQALESRTFSLLSEWKGLLVQMSLELMEAGELDAERVTRISNQHGLSIEVQGEGFIHAARYEEMMLALRK